MINIIESTNQTKDLICSELIKQTSDPLFRIPVFLSYATPYNDLQNIFLNNVVERIRATLLFPRTLGRSDQYTETPLTSIRRMMFSSYGCMAIAFRRSFVTKAVSKPGTAQEEQFDDFWLTSPYLQIEPSMAYQQGLPLMLLVEEGVSTNAVFGGILEQGAAPFNIIRFSLKDNQTIKDFFDSVFWKETFVDWVGQVRSKYTEETEPGC